MQRSSRRGSLGSGRAAAAVAAVITMALASVVTVDNPAAGVGTDPINPTITSPGMGDIVPFDEPLTIAIDYTAAPVGGYQVAVYYDGEFPSRDPDWAYDSGECYCLSQQVTADGSPLTVTFPAPGAGGRGWHALVVSDGVPVASDGQDFKASFPPLELSDFGPNPNYTTFYPTVRDNYRDKIYISWFASAPAEYVMTVTASNGNRILRTTSAVRGPLSFPEASWDGRDRAGSLVPVGRYRVSISGEAGGRTVTRSQMVEVAKGFRIVERTLRADGRDLSADTKGSCFVQRRQERIDLTCRGGAYARVWKVFNLPFGTKDARWKISGAVRPSNGPGSGTAKPVIRWPDDRHAYIGYEVTKYREARIYWIKLFLKVKKPI